jgi:hypothetical protein
MEFERQRLTIQRTNLHLEWLTRAEKLAELRRALIFETGVDRKLQLKQQIQTEEEEIELLNSKLFRIEQDLNRPE